MPKRSLWSPSFKNLEPSHPKGLSLWSLTTLLSNSFVIAGLTILLLLVGVVLYKRYTTAKFDVTKLDPGVILGGRKLKLPYGIEYQIDLARVRI
jgi:hypothetical protein